MWQVLKYLSDPFQYLLQWEKYLEKASVLSVESVFINLATETFSLDFLVNTQSPTKTDD